ncbi:MAG TPA: N-acetylmuramoyl-L-alanine amidase, partial [Rhodothermales bacterium]|nr:N-acetylmuramoyl-L-alanine amidase [Rhodothermales bacterium]
MKLETPGTRARREDIFRGVYEENRKIVNQPVDAKKIQSRRAAVWRMRVGLALAVVLVLAGGFRAYQEIAASQRSEQGKGVVPVSGEGLSAAERMAQEFRSPADPGVTEEGVFGTENEVPIANLFGLQVNTIVIDAGHGGSDPGAIGPGGTREKDITLDVARRLQRRLDRQGFQTLMTREGDSKLSLQERVDFANEQGADLFISIHVNALPAPEVVSVETYYFGIHSDAQTLQLAQRENADSDLSMANFREEIEKMGNTMKFQESKQLAGSIQKMLYRNMRRVNDDISDWGFKPGPFVVLLGVDVPGVLA